MKLKFVRFVAAVIAAAVLCCAVGCEFGTYVRTNQLPESSVSGFFDCIKSENFTECDEYLADHASFEIKNYTGYALADAMLAARLNGLRYEIISQPVVNGAAAMCVVRVSAPNVFGLKEAISEEYIKLKSRYVKDNELKSFPSDDKEVVDKVVTEAFNAVAAQAEESSVEIAINMSFQDGMWKINVTEELCTAILGEVVSNEE